MTNPVTHVVHISTERRFRGGERQLVRLHEGLHSRGLRSTIVCRSGGAFGRRHVAETIFVRWRGAWDPTGLAGMVRAIRRCGADIIHCHDSRAFTVGTLASVLMGLPVVVTRRVVFPVRRTALNRWRYGRCRRIIAVSAAVAEACRPVAGTTPIAVVHDGVAWDPPARSRDEVKRGLGLPRGTAVVGTVGFFTGEKNVSLVFALGEKLLASHPDARLLCIGPMDTASQARAAKLPNIVTTGLVHDAVDFYAAFDLYVSTATHEGLGSSILDAVVRDIPVVAMDSGGVRDIFPSGSRSLVATPDGFVPAVERVLKDGAGARRAARDLGIQARERFSIEQMVRGNIDSYRVCLGSTGHKTPRDPTSVKPAVSIIVAVFQQADILERVFASLTSQTFDDFEVIIADDGSGPDVQRVIERHRGAFRHPIHHVWHEDRGFRKTIIVNQAVTMANADYLVFIDGDCILHHRFIERHFRRRRPGIVLSGRRVMLDRELTARVTLDDVRSRRIEKWSFWWNHCEPHDRRHGIYLPQAFASRNLGRKDYQILGSNFSVHRDDLYRVNGYDERIIGRGLEDNNLWRRFVNSGVQVVCIAQEALQYHCYHESLPIPHSRDVVDEFHHTSATRTPYGIVKE